MERQFSLFLAKVWGLAGPYWSSEEKWSGILLLTAIMAMNLGTVYITVLINTWTKDFYNALQEANKAALSDLVRFAELAAAVYYSDCLYVYPRAMLKSVGSLDDQELLSRWSRSAIDYCMQFLRTNQTDNPDLAN